RWFSRVYLPSVYSSRSAVGGVKLGHFSRPAKPGDQAQKTAFAAADIDISQDRAGIPYMPAPL
ncbi:MAG: hypothetical protein ACHP82_06770, partial [Hyphomicrobiales bacterium]